MSGGRAFVAALALALALARTTARAQEEPVAVEYRAHEGCPDVTKFWQGVATRTQRATLAPSPPVSWTFRVAIDRDGGESVGHLEIEGAAGREERAARDASCAQVVDALALIVALTIDPRASLQPTGHPAPPASSAAEPPLRQEPSPAATLAAAPLAGPPTPLPLRATIGAHVLATGSIAPDLAWGGGLFAQLELAASRYRPALRLAGGYVGGPRFEAGSVGLRTELAFGRLEACPARFAIASFDLGACGSFELGVLRAVGLDVPAATSASMVWVAAGGAARVDWAPGGRWIIEVEGGLVAPFERNTIVLSPPRVVLYPIPGVGATLAAGVGFRFP